ncbi:STN domain-containing protein [Rhodospirillum centenum]|uniref:Secretin and TonB N terminus short domain protein n=1 Tax=Rhodospirillum centenum (strain ATCC 51521 / SW) TaxID=414684 RepID=B6IYT9_RHOCS|nr:STN domain-containing protein [Rhodospirillum centenum]ACJ01463.1 secretin and TonB N terminus short domain protein [Rhodospirillum centenum SW]
MTVGWFRAAATSLVAVSVMVGVAQAQAIRIDIPAGDLGPALTAFARASGLQILADPSMTDGLKTRGVSGEMAPREALEALFAGTGLGFELHGDAVIVRGTAPAPAEPAAPAPTRMKPEAAAAPAGEAMEELTITGYRVRATAGGTRIVTPLKDLPMSVQVVNQELIKDLGARKIEDAIRFVSGINKVNRNDNLGRGERSPSAASIPA